MSDYDEREDYFCPMTVLPPIRKTVWDIMAKWRERFNADSNYPIVIVGPLNEALGFTCIVKYAPNGKEIPLEHGVGKVRVVTYSYKGLERHISIYYTYRDFYASDWCWEVIRPLKQSLISELDLIS